MILMEARLICFGGLVVVLMQSQAAIGLNCYECGGTTGRDCSNSTDENKIVEVEKLVSCNDTAYSCMTMDRDGVVEQRSCWSRNEQQCGVQIEGQPRVCTCKEDRCNCFGKTGEQMLAKACPSPQRAAPLKSGGGIAKQGLLAGAAATLLAAIRHVFL